MGIILLDQGNFPEALKNHLISLKISESLADKVSIAASYNNIGNVYDAQKNYQEALKNYFARLKIEEEIDNKASEANPYLNIGLVYYLQGNYKEALKNMLISLNIREANGDKAGIAATFQSIGNVLIKQKKYQEAKKYLIQARDLSKEIGYKENLSNSYRSLSELDSAKGNFAGAFENYKIFILYRDSLNNEETSLKTLQTQMVFKFEKKEAVTYAEHKKELENQQVVAEEKKQKAKCYYSIFRFWVIISTCFYGYYFTIFKNYPQTKKRY